MKKALLPRIVPLEKSLGALFLTSAVLLNGCSDSSSEVAAQAPTSSSPSAPAQTNAMDVKQPEPQTVQKQPLVSLPANVALQANPALPQISPKEPVENVVAADLVEQKVEATLQEIQAQAQDVAQDVAKADESANPAIDGASVYSTCAGCHGGSAEGGIGPKLAGQAVDAIVAKLNRYKSGEQIGPLTGMMAPMAVPLSDEQMQAVAEYLSGL